MFYRSIQSGKNHTLPDFHQSQMCRLHMFHRHHWCHSPLRRIHPFSQLDIHHTYKCLSLTHQHREGSWNQSHASGRKEEKNKKRNIQSVSSKSVCVQSLKLERSKRRDYGTTHFFGQVFPDYTIGTVGLFGECCCFASITQCTYNLTRLLLRPTLGAVKTFVLFQ